MSFNKREYKDSVFILSPKFAAPVIRAIDDAVDKSNELMARIAKEMNFHPTIFGLSMESKARCYAITVTDEDVQKRKDAGLPEITSNNFKEIMMEGHDEMSKTYRVKKHSRSNGIPFGWLEVIPNRRSTLGKQFAIDCAKLFEEQPGGLKTQILHTLDLPKWVELPHGYKIRAPTAFKDDEGFLVVCCPSWNYEYGEDPKWADKVRDDAKRLQRVFSNDQVIAGAPIPEGSWVEITHNEYLEYNSGENRTLEEILRAHLEADEDEESDSKGRDDTEEFGAFYVALQQVVGGSTPPKFMQGVTVKYYLEDMGDDECSALQEWAIDEVSGSNMHWATGMGCIDAAITIVNDSEGNANISRKDNYKLRVEEQDQTIVNLTCKIQELTQTLVDEGIICDGDEA